jgi:hypothetical protein
MNMEQKVHTVVVDGITYEFYHISVRVLNKMIFRVLSMIGPAIAQSMDKELGKTREEIVQSLVGLLNAKLDPDVLDTIMMDLLSSTICVGKGRVTDKFDIIFTDISHLWKVVIEAGKYYFSSFFVEGSLLDKVMQKAKTLNT